MIRTIAGLLAAVLAAHPLLVSAQQAPPVAPPVTPPATPRASDPPSEPTGNVRATLPTTAAETPYSLRRVRRQLDTSLPTRIDPRSSALHLYESVIVVGEAPPIDWELPPHQIELPFMLRRSIHNDFLEMVTPPIFRRPPIGMITVAAAVLPLILKRSATKIDARGRTRERRRIEAEAAELRRLAAEQRTP